VFRDKEAGDHCIKCRDMRVTFPIRQHSRFQTHAYTTFRFFARLTITAVTVVAETIREARPMMGISRTSLSMGTTTPPTPETERTVKKVLAWLLAWVESPPYEAVMVALPMMEDVNPTEQEEKVALIGTRVQLGEEKLPMRLLVNDTVPFTSPPVPSTIVVQVAEPPTLMKPGRQLTIVEVGDTTIGPSPVVVLDGVNDWSLAKAGLKPSETPRW
jgi:hypothetical protein